jgi:hypothetical protein
VDAQVGRMIDLIERKYISTSSSDYHPIDFAKTAQYFTLDVISDLARGRPFGFLVEDKDLYNYLQNLDEFFPFIVSIAVIPGLPWLMDQWPFNRSKPKPTDEEGFGRLMRCVKFDLCNGSDSNVSRGRFERRHFFFPTDTRRRPSMIGLLPGQSLNKKCLDLSSPGGLPTTK